MINQLVLLINFGKMKRMLILTKCTKYFILNNLALIIRRKFSGLMAFL